MIRKALLTLLMLIGIVLSASCRPNQTSTTPEPSLPNPASVYCEQNGGKLELRQDATGGVAGVCVFPDGSECDEWLYYRGECKPGDSLVTSETTISSATASPSPTAMPVGLSVAYFKDGQLMLWTEGSGSRPLAASNSSEKVRISDDGQLVAYVSRDSLGSDEILGVDAGGANQRLLVGGDYMQNIQPAGQMVSFDFAPGSHMLYFLTDQYDLHRVDAAAGGSPASVFRAGKGGFFSFSPDGQWMALYHPNELVLAQSDGSDAQVVFQYPEDFRYTMIGPEIMWEPDSLGFHMVSASGAQGSPDSMTVWFIPVDGDPVRQMSYAGPYGANLSPDGRVVVYLYFQHEPIDVHVVAEDGKDTTYSSYASTTYANLNFMGWTPDSERFVLNLSDDGRFEVPYLSAVGQEPIKMTDTDDAHAIKWLDADRFLFVAGDALRLQRLGEPSILVDTVSSSAFDYAYISP